ncbi:discoidin domain-containing protein [Bacillaceae bacterium C204]|uniref:discoidin domain-containing protein n=1 Tax=Neobacillus sp. 204 TaxID=3383351 RepID=UPI00397B40EF
MSLKTMQTIDIVSLSGIWNYELDQNDIGLQENWNKRILQESGFRLPGTTALNQVGEPLELEPEMTKEAVKCLRQHHRYVGAVWYQKRISIPETWNNKDVTLFLERVMFESQVWVNGQKVGTFDSLSVPHVYDLTKHVVPGTECVLTIRIDNRDVQKIGPFPSAYTDETQTIWNGIIGKMELQATDKVNFGEVQLYPEIQSHSVKAKVIVNNGCDVNVNTIISAKVTDKNHNIIGVPIEINETIDSGKKEIEIKYEMGEQIQYWDEFNPYLYTFHLQVNAINPSEDHSNQTSIVFGMKEFKAEGRQFLINGKKTFLRGTLDCCIYPLTGFPPTDKESWKDVFLAVKEYGLNHVRFHSWCPPEAAFEAADEIGVYLNVEGPVWMDTWTQYTVGKYKSHYQYLPQEAERIIDTYGNHPSFCMFSNGNELNGDFGLLHDIIAELRGRDNRMVYTLMTNWDRKVDPAEDYFAAQTVDGVGIRGQYFMDKMVEGTMLDFSEGVKLREIPIVSHEVGQYSVYPDVEEIPLYNGVLKPVNFEAIKLDLEKKQMLKYAKQFTLGSGKLAAQLYKDEIEAALRTKDFGGFQLLDLHDFPGQSTATVGLLNSFWKSKGIISGEEFRKFCSPTVPILRTEKRIYSNNDLFSGLVEISHYGPAAIENTTVSWKITNHNGVVASGEFNAVKITQGTVSSVGKIENVSFKGIEEASMLRLSLQIEGTEYKNDWDLWVYPETALIDEEEIINESDILIASQFDTKVVEHLQNGMSVLLLPDVRKVTGISAGKFFPIFWSPVHFLSKDPCGIICDYDHPVFKRFPTNDYAQYQWKSLLENSFSISIENFPADFESIVNIIPNFYNNHKATNLFEARVGEGKILVCSIDITRDLEQRLEAKQLKRSILEYVASDKFSPKHTLTVEDMKEVFIEDDQGLSKEDRRKDLAYLKPASSNSEKSLNYAASKGNDGNPTTSWNAADSELGHWWQVDLGEVHEITGTRVTFLEEGNYRYEIMVSTDGDHWRLAAEQTSDKINDKVREDSFNESARYVRIIYNGRPQGIWAGHSEFQVFGK